MILNRPAPFGNRIRDFAKHVPRYKIEIEGTGADEVIRKFQLILVLIYEATIISLSIFLFNSKGSWPFFCLSFYIEKYLQ